MKLARILAETGRGDEAVAELQTAWEGLVAAGEERERGADVASEMVRVLDGLGRPTEAAHWAERAGIS